MLLRYTILPFVVLASANYGWDKHGQKPNHGYPVVISPQPHSSSTKTTTSISRLTTTSTSKLTSTTTSTSTTQTSTSTSFSLPPQVTQVTLPTDAEHLCPSFGGRCLNEYYIQCNRNFADDVNATISNYTCVDQPGVTSERQCQELCKANRSCPGWNVVQSLGQDALPSPSSFVGCCHLSGFAELQRPLPTAPASPVDSLYHSYAQVNRCPRGVGNLCPKAENGCVDNLLVRCGRPFAGDVTTRRPSVWKFDILTDLACHQACAQDPTCTAWDGSLEYLDPESGGAAFFNCYHTINRRVTLKPVLDVIPRPLNDFSYGIKNYCD